MPQLTEIKKNKGIVIVNGNPNDNILLKEGLCIQENGKHIWKYNKTQPEGEQWQEICADLYLVDKEIIVGTWINGTPIYRRVVFFTLSSEGLFVLDMSTFNADVKITSKAIILLDGGRFIPEYFIIESEKMKQFSSRFSEYTNELYIEGKLLYYSTFTIEALEQGRSGYVMIEYTKFNV